jgi:ABC-2 type transport system ATP-binding protein
MSLLVPSTADSHSQRGDVGAAYRPADRAILRDLTEGQGDALVVEHLIKKFEKASDLFAGLKDRFRKRDAEPVARPKAIRAVDDISLHIGRREIYGVLGSNGSGKSTLIRVISTLLLPDSGSVRVFGHDVEREAMAVQRLINRVSVEAAFFRKLSPMENLIYAARLYNLEIPTARDEIRGLLSELGIKADRFDQPLENMSRGMQQKVAIARAFLTAPVLLLLDEPTTGLDPRSKHDVQRFVTRLRDTHDGTVLLTTHDMEEAEALCDRIAIIDGGRIVAEDTPANLRARVGAELGQLGPATMNEVFMHFTGRDWEAEENDDEEDGAA